MKHTTGPRRGRPRGNGKRFSSGGKNQTYESTGPEVKIRGSAQQVHEKYLSLARDALSTGDRINAEAYFQFADHYFRIVTAANGNNNAANNGQGHQDRNNGAASSDSGDGDVVVKGSGAETRDDKAADKPSAAAQDGQQAEESTEAAAEAPAAQAESGSSESAGDEKAEGEAPKRRRRSPLGVVGRRSPGRPRKAAASEGEGEGDAPAVKTVRRRTRKPAAEKTDETATENV